MKTVMNSICFIVLIALSLNCSAQQYQQQMSPAQITEYLKGVQSHILAMHDLSNKILAETDPQKQQELKDQQLELMRKEMMSQRPN